MLDNNNQQYFYQAVEDNDLNKVKEFIKKDNVHPNIGGSWGFVLACKLGHIDIVNFLIEEGSSIFNDKNDEAIRMAAEFGHYDVVKILLTLDFVNPASLSNYAIFHAYYGKFYNIVELLAQDIRVKNKMTQNDPETFEMLRLINVRKKIEHF